MAWMKCELIDEKADEIFSEYTLGPHFIDFCRGPHVPTTSQASRPSSCSPSPAPTGRATRRTSSCSASTAPPSSRQKELDDHLKQMEEAKKRDHRKLGKELDLFSIQELAGPGLIFFHPKGGIDPQACSKTGCATST